MSRAVLVLFAHPAPHRSRANRAMMEAIRGLEGVAIHDLYETYPDLLIDVGREQALLEAHDAIVMQHPFYWYSVPALAKEWLDLVLAHGWAYGDNGTALHGKLWMQALSAGGREENYRSDGFNRFPVEDLLRPFEATAHLCGMVWRDPFVLHASHLIDNETLRAQAAAYRARILGLQRES